MKTVSMLMIAVMLGLTGCKTTGPAAESSKLLFLKTGDAPALVGLWEGVYQLQNGYRGNTKLTLAGVDETTVTGVFEYIWDGGYDRYPNAGTVKGVIKPDGKLHFGSWQLSLY